MFSLSSWEGLGCGHSHPGPGHPGDLQQKASTRLHTWKPRRSHWSRRHMYDFRTLHPHPNLHMEGQLTGPWSPHGMTRFRTMLMKQGEVTAVPVFPSAQSPRSVCKAALCFLAFLLDHTLPVPRRSQVVIVTLGCTEEIILSERVTTVTISAFHSEY